MPAVNTKVDMRFNVKNAHWLSERVKEKIMQMVSCYLSYFLFCVYFKDELSQLRESF